MDQLKFAIIHALKKERTVREAEVQLRGRPLDVGKAPVLKLATQLANLMGRDENAVSWGQFGDRRREGLFPGATAELADHVTEEAFLQVAHTAMTELAGQASEENFATGGYIFFACYAQQAATYLLIAMIKERGGITLGADFEPTEVNEVDLSKLHQAARINLNRYAEFLAQQGGAPIAADEEKTYLCFVNRKGKEDVAGYFIQALGCERGVSSGRATSSLIKAVKNYVKGQAAIANKASEARQAVIDYLQSLPDHAIVELDHVIRVVQRVVAVDQYELLEGLKLFLNSEEMQIPNEFPVSKTTLKSYIRIAAKADQWNLNFESGALGIADSEIVYDRARHTLTLTRLPPETVRKIEDTLRDRGQLAEE
ncbi:nucleoid-associated protein [Dyella dinghuensis]|uniref:Nucleoid-associated protein n=1 Tax=Dyella dinghuensis TaxID=1920169 RepID=A0A432LUW3_9GAMM|nr:nucleoid-associated protein [Dyella dinghuensis]RUL65781.1 nucleoid-associated protein [Dyella dinghuensis]